MKKNLLLVTMALLGYLTAFGQNPSWSIGNNNFYAANNYPLPIPQFDYGNTTMPNSGNQNLGYQGQLPTNASNMISDPSGNIVFFIVDNHVYNKNGYSLGNLNISNYAYDTYEPHQVKGASEILIIPNPVNCNQYYIISTRIQLGIYEKLPWVFLLDMGVQNYQSQEYSAPQCIMGELVPIGAQMGAGQNIGLSIETLAQGGSGDIQTPWFVDPNDPSPGKLSNIFLGATKKTSNNEHFVFISNTYNIFRFKISAAGFTFDNAVIPFLSVGQPDYNSASVRSELEVIELANGNFRIACPFYKTQNIGSNTAWEWLYTSELNTSGEVIPSTVHTFPFFKTPGSQTNYTDAALKGLEFSGDGNILYVTHSTNSVQPNQLEYFNYNNPTTSLVPLAISSSIDAKYSLLERDVNNSIYFTGSTGMYKLTNVNTPSTNVSLVSSNPGAFNFENNGTAGFFSDLSKLYLLPDQIDKMNYSSVFMDNLQCCIASSFFNRTDIINVSTGGLWQDNAIAPGSNPLIIGNGSTALIKKSIYIKAGVTLTIKNMTLRFAPDARIVVENGSSTIEGGKLILDGTTLTVDDRCDPNALWWGCEVWGNNNLLQQNFTSSNQGRLEMKNNAKIEFAKIGILVGKRQMSSEDISTCEVQETVFSSIFLDDRTGGIISITNSKFENNITGIMMRKYLPSSGANNVSFIKTSDFSWNNTLHGSIIKEHIDLRSVKGINIQANNFRNLNTTNPSLNLAGTGINSTNAQFFAVSKCNTILPIGVPCTDFTPCIFEGLKFGINTSNTNAFNYEVNRSNFKNCFVGILTVGTKNERITECFFEIPELTTGAIGIETFGSSGYKIEKNEFYETSPTSIGLTYGVIINNSGVSHNEVYRNKFRFLHIGGQSEKINGSTVTNVSDPVTVSSTGLQWICNSFRMPITETDLGVNGIIDFHQGYIVNSTLLAASNAAARNEFSMSGETNPVAHDIKLSSNSQPINYVHLFSTIHTPDNVSASVSTTQQTFNTQPVVPSSNNCPSKLIAKQTSFEIIELHKTASSLESLIDGDSTAQLLEQLLTSPYPYNVVSPHSPYLSDEVLIAFLNSSATISQKKSILEVQAPFSFIVKNAVINSTLPLSTKNNLLAIGGVSPMEYLAIHISDAKSNFDEAYSNTLGQMYLDTIVQSNDIIDFLTEINTDQSKMDLAEYYIQINELDLANSLLSELEATNSDFVDFSRLIINLNNYNSVSEAFDLDPTLLSSTELIASFAKDARVQVLAQALIDFRGNYREIPAPLPLNGGKMNSNNSTAMSTTSNSNLINMYPNPSSGIVSFSISEEINSIVLNVFDLNGRVVFSKQYNNLSQGQIDLSHLNKGFYIVDFKINNAYSEIKKLELK